MVHITVEAYMRIKSLYDAYGKQYPKLCFDILMFFKDKNIETNFKSKGLHSSFYKCPQDYIMYEAKKRDAPPIEKVKFHPRHLSQICEILYGEGILMRAEAAEFGNSDGKYTFYAADPAHIINIIIDFVKNKDDSMLAYRLNCIVYGFQYIYDQNKANVLPIYVKKGDRYDTGSCVRTIYGIITAKHCLQGDEIQIKGIPAEKLSTAPITTLDYLDLVVIHLDHDFKYPHIEEADILDKVIMMGYPRHAGFDNFLTVTSGEVAAIEKPILEKYDLMLIACQIKGGHSGGPVFNKYGMVVGIATEIIDGQGEDYDNFGYGLAIPSKYIELLTRDIDETKLYKKKIKFVNQLS